MKSEIEKELEILKKEMLDGKIQLQKYIDEMEKNIDEMSENMSVINDVLINSHKEISMWREKYLESAYLSHNKQEQEYIKKLFMSIPSGIENIQKDIDEIRRYYREDNKCI